MRVEVLEPERVLTVRFADGTWVWIFALTPEGGGTRLVSRNRVATRNTSPQARLFRLYVMEPGSLVVERKMLSGIQERAERSASSRPGSPPMPAPHAASLARGIRRGLAELQAPPAARQRARRQ